MTLPFGPTITEIKVAPLGPDQGFKCQLTFDDVFVIDNWQVRRNDEGQMSVYAPERLLPVQCDHCHQFTEQRLYCTVCGNRLPVNQKAAAPERRGSHSGAELLCRIIDPDYEDYVVENVLAIWRLAKMVPVVKRYNWRLCGPSVPIDIVRPDVFPLGSKTGLRALCSFDCNRHLRVYGVRIIDNRGKMLICPPERPVTRPCPNCGAEIPLKAAFCGECPHALGSVETGIVRKGRPVYHHPVAYPILANFRQYMESTVLRAYDARLQRQEPTDS